MKQRLVGVIVLGCLAIIFLPILLDGEGVTPAAMTRNIPPGPAIPERLEIEPVRPNILADTDELNLSEELEGESITIVEDEEASIINPASNEEPSIADIVEVVRGESPELGIQGIPESWSLRLASFGNKRNANALIARLVEDDHKAYSRPTESAQGALTSVYIGPFLSRPEAGRWQSELEGKYNLSGKGIIVEFSIEELAE